MNNNHNLSEDFNEDPFQSLVNASTLYKASRICNIVLAVIVLNDAKCVVKAGDFSQNSWTLHSILCG
jgi:hypothetical protein